MKEQEGYLKGILLGIERLGTEMFTYSIQKKYEVFGR